MSDQNDLDRITRLETHFEYVRSDLTDLKQDVKDTRQDIRDLTKTVNALVMEVRDLPTKNDLWSWKIQWLAVGLAEIVLIVGSIIGGLDWIKNH